MQDYSTNTFEIEPQRRGGFPWGCVLGGCLGAMLLTIVGVALTGFSAYWFLSNQIAKYTSQQPRELPAVEFTEEQINEVEKRIEQFHQSVQDQKASEQLVLSEEDLNALLASDENLKDHVYVHIEEGQIRAEVSMPTDMLPGGKGRFFNGEITFEISLENGELIARIDQASVGGQPIPEAVMRELRKENIGRDIMKDVEVRNNLEHFERIVVEEDHIILVPKLSDSSRQNGTPNDENRKEPGDD